MITLSPCLKLHSKSGSCNAWSCGAVNCLTCWEAIDFEQSGTAPQLRKDYIPNCSWPSVNKIRFNNRSEPYQLLCPVISRPFLPCSHPQANGKRFVSRCSYDKNHSSLVLFSQRPFFLFKVPVSWECLVASSSANGADVAAGSANH